jgi:hypothetical protein
MDPPWGVRSLAAARWSRDARAAGGSDYKQLDSVSIVLGGVCAVRVHHMLL